jgi:type IV pilus assembly protein PilV
MNKSYQILRGRLNRPIKGFALIEVLVSVVVFSIGLIGLASLQTISLKHNNTSYMRSQAILLAQDIADRMRANMAAVNAGDYNMNSVTPDVVSFTCTDATSCDSQEIAQMDLYLWETGNQDDDKRSSVAEVLPGGQGIVCIDTQQDTTRSVPSSTQCDAAGSGGNVYAIKIWWDENHDGAVDSKDPVFITSFRP